MTPSACGLVVVAAIAAMGRADAMTLAPPPAAPDAGVVLVFSAGGSKIAFQAGAAARMLSEPSERAYVKATAGVSLGALNALIAAIETCHEHPRLALDDNLFLDAERELSLDRLFPGELSCADYAARFPELGLSCPEPSVYGPGDGVLTLKALQPLRWRLEHALAERGVKEGCATTLGFSLSSDTPMPIRLGPQTVSTSRRTVLVELRSVKTKTGLRLAFCSPNQRPDGLAPSTVSLPSTHEGVANAVDGCAEVSTDSVFDLLVASATIPPFLPPRSIDVCGVQCEASPTRGLYCADGSRLCRERVFDGAVFDPTPLSAGREAAISAGLLVPGPTEDPTTARYVVFDATVHGSGEHETRPCGAQPEATDGGPGARGIAFYEKALAEDFVRVAQRYEKQLLFRYGLLEPATLDVVIPGDELVGEFLGSYGGWVDRRFGEHDYCVGLEDRAREVPLCGLHAGSDQQTIALSLREACDAATADGRPHSGFKDFARALEAHRFEAMPAGDSSARRGSPAEFELPAVCDTEVWLADTARMMLRRAGEIERSEGNTGMAAALTVGEFAAAKQVTRPGPWLTLGGHSSLPPSIRKTVPGILGLVLPNTVLFEPGGASFRVTWELLTFRFPKLTRLWLTGGAGLRLSRDPSESTGWGAQAQVVFDWGGRVGELAARWTGAPLVSSGGMPAHHDFDLVWRALGHLELGIGAGPPLASGQPWRVGLVLGVTDLSGLAYWVVRAATGDDGAYGELGKWASTGLLK